jgi:hypothetical protein
MKHFVAFNSFLHRVERVFNNKNIKKNNDIDFNRIQILSWTGPRIYFIHVMLPLTSEPYIFSSAVYQLTN